MHANVNKKNSFFKIYLDVHIHSWHLPNFIDAMSCPNDCNGYGSCDEDTGKCFCPGFSGTSCGNK